MTAPARLSDEQRAALAFEVHAALLRTEATNPKLKENPLWLILRQDSFEEFYVAMDKIA
ncbi:hypothetical protein [Novosphingobium sp.]|uniref:hypothetical protein n=1 Tax=Novosphingobium sp. TaxID=1874826 RepID=UPI00260790D9|nr:hypothetical protein [Novosphingobium sp.]